MKVKFTMSLGYGSTDKIIDLPNDWADDQIEAEFQSWLDNLLDCSWTRLE